MTVKFLTSMCLLFACISAHAQKMDTDAMMKWATAEAVRYHIVGEYQARDVHRKRWLRAGRHYRSRGHRPHVEAFGGEARRPADVSEHQDRRRQPRRP